MKRLSLKIYGKVQGVTFRFSARKKAEELGIRGWSRNNQDGTVDIEAEGQEECLRDFLQWCYQGPADAKVEKISEKWSDDLNGYKTFETRF